MSFSEQIAAAAANLQKKGTVVVPQKAKEELKQPPQLQRKMSHMDALKEQIMLRQRALNPDKKKEEGGASVA